MGPGNNKHIISDWEQVSGNNRAFLISSQTDGAIRGLFSWDGTSFSNIKTGSSVLNFSWKHLVVTINNGSTGFYVNAINMPMTVTTPWGGGAVAMKTTNIPYIIGGHSPSAPPLDTSPGGCMMHASRWNKVLSQAEITELYNNGAPYDITTHSAAANLTNFVPMDQRDTGSSLIDIKTGSANLTIQQSGTTGYFNLSDNYPSYNTNAGVLNVRNSSTYWFDSQLYSGSAVIPVAANVRLNTPVDASVGALDLPAVGNVVSGVQFDSNTKTGTYSITSSIIATAVLDTLVEPGFTLKEATRLMLSTLAGKVSGGGTATVVFRDVNDTKNRIVAAVDNVGNRSSVTKDVT